MTEPKTILVIEDDRQVRQMVGAALANLNCRIIEADNAEVGLNLLQTRKPDLVILDIHLPDGNGLQICKKIREGKALPSVAIIMLTGRGDLETKISGFEAGADQYLAKPVHPKELLMWVQALLRRLRLDQGEGGELQVGDLVINVDSHFVRYREQTITDLTLKELELLYFLVRGRPRVLSRKYILSNLWHTVAVDHVVDTHIYRLRKKVPQDLADRIQNVPGKGFRFLE